MYKDSHKLLIIDDDESITTALSRILSKYGYEVDTAHHPLEATHLCQVNFYSAIILDCLLPGKSGLQLAKEIKSYQEKNTHYIFISGTYSDPSFINSCLSEIGGSRFYIKPFNASLLVDYLDQVLRGNYKNQLLLEKIFTLPNPSGSELIQLIKEQPNIIGYELPFIITQMSRLKVSKTLNIYKKDELCIQVRFNNGNIVQLFNFMGNKQQLRSEVRSLNEFVNSENLELQLCTPEGRSCSSRIIFSEIKAWAESCTFCFLPIYWVSSRLLPIIACKLYSSIDFDIRLKMHECWPLVETEDLGLESITGCTLLNKLFSSSRKNEDLFYCVYNYLLNGSAWADTLKKQYDEESVSLFFSWHYHRLVKRNYFEVLEIQENEEVESSRILPIYKRVLKELKSLNISQGVSQWIELESALLKSCINNLNSERKKKLYLEEINCRASKEKLHVEEIYNKLFFCLENNQPERLINLLAPLVGSKFCPPEINLLKIWALLKIEGKTYSRWHLKELRCEAERLPLESKFYYLFKLVEANLVKLEGDKRVARRFYSEAKQLNPNSRAAGREILAIDSPSRESLPWWNQVLQPLLKRIDNKTKSA